MQNQKIDFQKTGSFSRIFLDYISNESTLQPFYPYQPTLDTFQEVMDTYENKVDRGVLVEALQDQYFGLEYNDTVATNMRLLLNENTFTVTTGHQLNIFSGPVFFIYKIVTTINLAKQLQERYPMKHFVPVYWMATEDHDFAEINHFNLFGKKYTWETEQTGAVGKFQLKELEKLVDDLPEKIELFEKAYKEFENLTDATRYFVNELFQDQGLIIIDGDDVELKKLFIPTIKEELTKQVAMSCLEDTNLALAKIGYKPQINPRDINLFYLKDDLRQRITKNGDHYEVVNTDIVFSQTEILKELEQHPERFSPNVALRPVYQQILLPNLAYIGGPGELAYWVQLKSLFEQTDSIFPIFIPRNFALYLSKANTKKMNKLGINAEDLFLEKHMLLQHYLVQNTEGSFHLKEETETLEQLFEKIMIKVKVVDASLSGFVGAEEKKIIKSFKNIEKRLKKTEENKQEAGLKQVEVLKEKLFPNHGLQERVENYLNYSINHPNFIEELLETFDPLDFRFNILIHE